MSRLWLPVLLALASPTAADTPDPPCDGCAIAFPDGDDPVALLVVLHGDRGTATSWLARWRDAAHARSWGVLALQCPEELGCNKGVWIDWGGAPTWIHEQIDKVTSIDRANIYLAGWSGGAAYLGLHLKSWAGFGGVVMHGGGVTNGGRCPSPAPPVYFLVGNKNRYHQGAVWLREHAEDCRSRVRWDLIENGDHGDEARALTPAKTAKILDWLVKPAKR